MILDGTQAAAFLKILLNVKVSFLKKSKGVIPVLAAIRVGEDPASQIYLSRKKKIAESLSFRFQDHIFPENASFEHIEEYLIQLNEAPEVHGILIQLPLPRHINPYRLVSLLNPEKDVDGLHPLNSGKLLLGKENNGFVPCTPLGCLMLLKYFGFCVEGKEAVIVGRSILVGKPLALLLLQEQATVTIAHSYTQNLAEVTSRADYLFVAAGQQELIRAHHVKPGACVIDIGIHRVESVDKATLVGDVHFEEVQKIAGAITPVPGGVGPMTVMGLMHNTLKAAYQLCGLPFQL